MYLIAALSMALNILCETASQLAYKNAHRVPNRKIMWTLIGASMYVPQTLALYFALTILPLSIGAPLMGASYMTVPLASKFLFGENISKRRWLGILFIVGGLILISREMPQ